MGKETYLAHTISQTEYEARYDKAAKKLLANKLVLAHILKGCVAEYSGCNILDIAGKYIEGEPEIGTVGVHIDDTGRELDTKVQGINSEESSQYEGNTFYDVRFNAIAPQAGRKEVIRLIINVEAQNEFSLKYPLIKRAIYYCGRMISAQYGTVFTKSDYRKLRKVYSIWVCVNTTKNFRNTITRYSISPCALEGNVIEDSKDYDMMSVVMVCLGSQKDWDGNDLIKFLGVLFHSELSAKEKKGILEKDFNIPMTENVESEVNEMCNLSQGVAQAAKERGEAAKLYELVNRYMKKNSCTVEEACDMMGVLPEEYRMAEELVREE